MYSIYTTPGFIIDSRPYGEAGKLIFIFTRDAGLVTAIAQGIRLEKSKLRYHAQNYSTGVFSFVRGKEFWRLTSAQDGGDAPLAPASRELAAKIAAVLKRLLQGEEPHPELYLLVEACISFLRQSPELSPEESKTLESVAVLRILNALGYIGREEMFEDVAGGAQFSADMLRRAVPVRQAMNKAINAALKESHL